MADPLPDALRAVVREYGEACEAGRTLTEIDQLRIALAILAALPTRDYPTPLLLLHVVNIHEIADRLEAETAAEKGRRSGKTSRMRSRGNPVHALLAAAQALRAKHPDWSRNRIAEHLAEQPKWKAVVSSRATETRQRETPSRKSRCGRDSKAAGAGRLLIRQLRLLDSTTPSVQHPLCTLFSGPTFMA